MSETGWRTFLEAGLDDWVVLHGGATAVFCTGSWQEGASLATAVTAVAGLEGSGAALTLGEDRVSVRLTRDIFTLEAEHVDLARAVSAVVAEHGARADRAAVQEVSFAVAARPEDADVGFWRAVLGYDAPADDNGTDPLAHSSTVWLQELDPDKPLRHAMHVDVSVAHDHAVARLEAALAAGGTVVQDDSPDAWILSDRAGNKVCIASWPDGGASRDDAATTEGDLSAG
jgi:4a-hydroxytetrahydrobiopterin dehydratase